MAKMELLVDGMSCGGCVASVERALGALDSVASVKVDLATRRVVVSGPQDLSRPELVAAIERAGFEVVDV